MRELSQNKEAFSFSFMSFNSSLGRSEGIVKISKARLLERQSEKFHRHAEIVEKYMNLDTMEARQFYQPLLMSLNDEKIELEWVI